MTAYLGYKLGMGYTHKKLSKQQHQEFHRFIKKTQQI